MRTIAFVGASGTGKSHRAFAVAAKNGADAMIDDGLLISGGRVVAGSSAKGAPTRLASVRQALFFDKRAAREVSEAAKKLNPSCVMVLGTSDAMVKKIAEALEFPPIERIIHIEDVATEEEIRTAQQIRTTEGKHIIPVPEPEIKKDFSGYFMHPLRFLQKGLGDDEDIFLDKTIMRPAFSYLGDYTISDNVIEAIVKHEALKEEFVRKVLDVNIRTTTHGAHIDIILTLNYGCIIPRVCAGIQKSVRTNVERYTSINARRVHIFVKTLHTK